MAKTRGFHASGVVASESDFNLETTFLAGAATSVLTLTGLTSSDVLKKVLRLPNKSAGTAAVVSDLTSYSVAGTDQITMSGKTTGSSLVFVVWIDVSK